MITYGFEKEFFLLDKGLVEYKSLPASADLTKLCDVVKKWEKSL